MPSKPATRKHPKPSLGYLHYGADVEISRQHMGKLVEIHIDEGKSRWTKLVTDQGHELRPESHAILLTTPARIILMEFQQPLTELSRT